MADFVKAKRNLDGQAQYDPLDYMTVENVRVTRCAFKDHLGDRCYFPGTVQTGQQWHCMPHHLLLTGQIDDQNCAERIRKRRVGLKHETNDMFEEFHKNRVRKEEAA